MEYVVCHRVVADGILIATPGQTVPLETAREWARLGYVQDEALFDPRVGAPPRKRGGVRCAFIGVSPALGSEYKYHQMFARVADCSWTPETGGTDYDIAIVHGDNRNDYTAALAMGRPYILVVQDVLSMRSGCDRLDSEREQVESAGAILFTSEDHRDWMAERYALPPHEIVHLRPLASDLVTPTAPKIPRSAVYAGGVLPARFAREELGGLYGYRCYHSLFRAILGAGWDVHIYPGYGQRDSTEYEALGCVWHDQLPQRSLYEELSHYAVGIQAYAKTGPQAYIKTCRPNKLWDYLTAGIPTLGYNTGNGARLYHGRWGVAVDSLKAIPGALERASGIQITPELQESQTMDGDLEKFARLVEVAGAAL